MLAAGTAVAFDAADAADLPNSKSAVAAAIPAPCFGSFYDWLRASAQECPLSYLGITVYGQIDVGAGYSSHGASLNRDYPQGVQEVIAKFSQGPRYQLVPSGLGRSNVGIMGKEDFAPGWSFVFNINTDFDPYTLRLANGPASLVENNERTIGNQSANGNSSRAGQWDNTQGYVGVKNPEFGALTIGRQNSLTADAVTKYDSMGGSYAFSLIGNSATYVSGGGDTETTRYNSSVKYQVNVGDLRAGAVWQFGGYEQGNGSNGAYQFDLGGDYAGFSLDTIYGYAKDAVSLSAYRRETTARRRQSGRLEGDARRYKRRRCGREIRLRPIQLLRRLRIRALHAADRQISRWLPIDWRLQRLTERRQRHQLQRQQNPAGQLDRRQIRRPKQSRYRGRLLPGQSEQL